MYTPYQYPNRQDERETFVMPEAPKELTPLTDESLAYLETNRVTFERMKTAGTVRGLDVGGLYMVMINHFDIEYKRPKDSDWDSVFNFLKELYRHYDEYLSKK